MKKLIYKIIEFFCSHRWEKDGDRKMAGDFFADSTTYIQLIFCNKCGKKGVYKFQSEL